jgi:hypothetical protein
MWLVALFSIAIGVFLAPLSLREILLNYTIAYSVLYVISPVLCCKFARKSLPISGRFNSFQSTDGG